MSFYHTTMTWMRGHPVWAALIVLSIGLIMINGIAYQHACAMLWFTDAGERTPRPQDLSLPRKIAVLLTGIRVPRPENDRTPESISLAYQTVRIPVEGSVELEAWSIPTPHAKGTVILFHGYASVKSNLLPEASAFHELGYDVWLVDFRGSGGSTEKYTTVGVREADDVAAVVAYVRESSVIQPLILYGNSMGAAAILRSMAKYGVTADGVILTSIFDRLLSTARNRFHQMGLPGFPGANLLLFWGGVSGGFSGFRHNPVDDAASCHCPVLMLHGEIDPNAKLEEASHVQRHLGDKESHLEVFPKTGHSSLLAADPDRWHRAISQFFSNRLAVK